LSVWKNSGVKMSPCSRHERDHDAVGPAELAPVLLEVLGCARWPLGSCLSKLASTRVLAATPAEALSVVTTKHRHGEATRSPRKMQFLDARDHGLGSSSAHGAGLADREDGAVAGVDPAGDVGAEVGRLPSARRSAPRIAARAEEIAALAAEHDPRRP